MIVAVVYIAIFIVSFALYSIWRHSRNKSSDFNSLKTVTFGDESTVISNRIASIISVITIFFLWGIFTNSVIVPFHVPGPFTGNTSFAYTASIASIQSCSATIYVHVGEPGNDTQTHGNTEANKCFTGDNSIAIQKWQSGLLRLRSVADTSQGSQANTKIDGKAISPGKVVRFADGEVLMTASGDLFITPDRGWQMEPIWLPAPEAVVRSFIDIALNGYKNFTLLQHVGTSVMRVLVGFILGCIVGIPLGYAMGLSSWFRGWFDPIVEFMRPVPPLALIPLVIIWFGIGEKGKFILLFLSVLWIMIIAARASVSGVRVSKIHAAYSLGASKRIILTHVIVPNSLPEIFTGARVAMGVCWSTVVAAELVAANEGIGMMIMTAAKFQQTNIVLMGIIIIGIIGYGIDILIRITGKWLVPWKGKG